MIKSWQDDYDNTWYSVVHLTELLGWRKGPKAKDRFHRNVVGLEVKTRSFKGCKGRHHVVSVEGLGFILDRFPELRDYME